MRAKWRNWYDEEREGGDQGRVQHCVGHPSRCTGVGFHQMALHGHHPNQSIAIPTYLLSQLHGRWSRLLGNPSWVQYPCPSMCCCEAYATILLLVASIFLKDATSHAATHQQSSPAHTQTQPIQHRSQTSLWNTPVPTPGTTWRATVATRAPQSGWPSRCPPYATVAFLDTNAPILVQYSKVRLAWHAVALNSLYLFSAAAVRAFGPPAQYPHLALCPAFNFSIFSINAATDAMPWPSLAVRHLRSRRSRSRHYHQEGPQGHDARCYHEACLRSCFLFVALSTSRAQMERCHLTHVRPQALNAGALRPAISHNNRPASLGSFLCCPR
ncbi:hypothetical protein EDB83DRAFT_1613640 [Lactarius deliciosus]|nr:hypothetical protein EDB83DRAFT_1613640 [Lactarius deliciosus]